MNSHFNRQFILIDFRLLEDRSFLQFLSSSEFATYLVLRRNVWRSPKVHYMGLHALYEKERQLVCSLTREKIGDVVGVALDNISRHLSALESKGIIHRLRTGRQNIYVLGEWFDANGDGSYRIEWFYMEGVFGVSKDDLIHSVRSDPAQPSDQTQPPASDINRKGNREVKTVNGIFGQLPNLKQPQERTAYVAQTILQALGDDHSLPFYRLLAAKVPESEILRALAEIKADGATNPSRLFTYKMKQVVLKRRKAQIGHGDL